MMAKVRWQGAIGRERPLRRHRGPLVAGTFPGGDGRDTVATIGTGELHKPV